MNKHIKISSKITNIRKVENLIEELSVKFNLKDDLYGNVLITVIEAVTNAIVHGNKHNENKFVHIHILAENKTLLITIEDEGNGFEFDKVSDPTTPDNIENINGRGIFLMRHLADEVIYEKNGSVVNIKFNI